MRCYSAIANEIEIKTYGSTFCPRFPFFGVSLHRVIMVRISSMNVPFASSNTCSCAGQRSSLSTILIYSVFDGLLLWPWHIFFMNWVGLFVRTLHLAPLESIRATWLSTPFGILHSQDSHLPVLLIYASTFHLLHFTCFRNIQETYNAQ